MFGSAPKQASSPAVPADMATQQSAELSDSARKQFLTLTQQLMDMKHKIEDTMQNLEGDIELLNRPECRRAEAKGRDSAGATEVDRGLENGRKSVASHPSGFIASAAAAVAKALFSTSSAFVRTPAETTATSSPTTNAAAARESPSTRSARPYVEKAMPDAAKAPATAISLVQESTINKLDRGINDAVELFRFCSSSFLAVLICLDIGVSHHHRLPGHILGGIGILTVFAVFKILVELVHGGFRKPGFVALSRRYGLAWASVVVGLTVLGFVLRKILDPSEW